MLPGSILNQTVVVKRRQSQGTDTLNNPIYGAPTNGAGWSTIYQGMPVRLAFNTKKIDFTPQGERIPPAGVMYYNSGYDLKAEDRILVPTSDNGTIEYTVISVVAGLTFGSVVDHYEAILQLP